MSLILQLALVLVLVVVNAAFSGSELALLSLREGQLSRLEQRGRTGRVLARLAREPNQFLATIQIGITLAGFLASAFAAVSLAKPLEDRLAFLGGAAGAVSVVIVTLLLTYVTLVLGELAPKRVAMQRAEPWALFMARPLAALSTATRPAVWLLAKSTDVVVRLFGIDPSEARQPVTEEELRDLVESHESITDEQRQILSGAFEIAGRTVEEVQTPRRDVVTIDGTTPAHRALQILVGAGRSRAPVVEGDLDRTIGVVHLRDLATAADEAPSAGLARPAVVVPETLGVLDALKRLRAERAHLALVVDEYGSVAGIVTLEDLLEEIVGEIYDETDRDLGTVAPAADGTLELPGRFPIHDLVDVGVELPEGDYTTVAGLVLSELGRVPEQGDQVEVDGWRIEVLGVDRRAITAVRLVPLPRVE